MYKFLFIVFFVVPIASCNTQQEYGSNQYENSISESVDSVVEAFEEAEKNVYDKIPVIPDDKPLGPDPDINKCACKGTGRIVHGDGHVTKCPFHLTELLIRNYEEEKENEK
tara:strand:- start:128 stop:460 length:333 start_codon:yes stop_codon:yes gene_type:complete